MSAVLVTGADGFVGRTLNAALLASGHQVRAASRRGQPLAGCESVAIGDSAAEVDWRPALAGIDTVVHLAARAHVLRDADADPLASYRRVNVTASGNLARAAASAGVKRLVFLSSIKVNGERTLAAPFTEADPPRPIDAYGRSKQEAEALLRDVATMTGLETVIVRAPLVYGPGVRANFLRLLGLVERGLPLPLAAIANRRSMIFVGNLADALTRCVEHPHAAGETFLVADGEDLSTPDLVRLVAAEMGVKARLFACPPGLLRLAATLLGKGEEAARLMDSLTLDPSHIHARLAWRPPLSVREGIAATVRWYRARPR